jgi:hypothetical protein
MTLHRLVVAAIFASILSSTALACGDSLYRAGKGVSYRTYSAPLPGNLLIFGNSEGARLLADELAKSGHDVQLVSNSSDLAQQLESGRFDVVIAPYGEHQSVESANSGSRFIPIAVGDDEERQAKKSYARVMVPEKHEIKHYLKAIHRALKESA